MTPTTRAAVVFAALVSFAACSGGSDDVNVAGSVGAPDVAPSSSVATVSTVGETETEAGTDAPVEVDDGGDVASTKDVRTRSDDAVGDGNPPEGFGTAVVRITSPDGEVCDVCMWLADSAEEQSQGLRGVEDLGGPVGMAFLFDPPTTSNFFMFETPTPLSIAWFDPSGSYLSAADMSPCLDETSTRCERYGTTGDYTLAIEMFQFQLGTIGIGPGSTAAIISVFDGSRCDLSR